MPKKLSYEDFLTSFTLAPRLAVEIVVKNDQGQILLLKRESEPFKNYWHLPGGFLLKDETIKDCFARISRDELGIPFEYTSSEFAGVFENISGDPRGHILHYVTCFTSNNVAEGRFFNIIPVKTISYQREFLNKLGFK